MMLGMVAASLFEKNVTKRLSEHLATRFSVYMATLHAALDFDQCIPGLTHLRFEW